MILPTRTRSDSQAQRSQSTQLDLDPLDPDDKVYGIRQEYAAVEFEKVLGGWLEVEGRFDKAPPGSRSSEKCRVELLGCQAQAKFANAHW